jgi:molybdate transport system ATP-binding protein
MSLNIRIKKNFGQFKLDIKFEAGNERIALLGASGCGKSMTLKCIAGIETPDEGQIILDGITLFDSEKHINLPPQKRCTGMLFQNYAVFPNMTVEQNINTGIRGKKSRAERKQIVNDIVNKLHLDGLEKHHPSQLSGGQQQRTALARILVSEPKILMLDEPFSALDSYLRWQLELELAQVFKDLKCTILYVSHNRDEVFRLCDRIVVIEKGTVDIISEKWKLFDYPKTYSAALLTGCKNISGARKISDSTVYAEDFGLELNCRNIPNDIKYVGIRAQQIMPVFSDESISENEVTFQYNVVSIIEDTFKVIMMIQTKTAEKTLPIRWEMEKELYRKIVDDNTYTAKIAKNKILLLR